MGEVQRLTACMDSSICVCHKVHGGLPYIGQLGAKCFTRRRVNLSASLIPGLNRTDEKWMNVENFLFETLILSQLLVRPIRATRFSSVMRPGLKLGIARYNFPDPSTPPSVRMLPLVRPGRKKVRVINMILMTDQVSAFCHGHSQRPG